MTGATNPSRVLLHAFSTFRLGGPQARFVQLANALGPRYHHVVVAMDNCFEAGERLEPHVSWEPLTLPIQRGGALANRQSFRSLLKARRPDLLLSYNWGAIEWAAANIPKSTPHVHVEDGFGLEEAGQQLQRRIWTRRILLGWAQVPVVVASNHLRQIALNTWKLHPSRVQFIPNGVATDNTTDSIELTVSPPIGRLTIGTVAGLRPEKNIARLIKAFAAVRVNQNVRLLIVGGGSELSALQQLVATLGVAADVEFTGYLKDPSQRLAEFDLFALSSNTEQLPIAMLEAMAMGVPVMATRVGDVEDILPEIARAALCEADDAAFTAAMHRTIALRHEWPQWARAGKTKVRSQYSLANMQKQWQHLFDGQINHVFIGT